MPPQRSAVLEFAPFAQWVAATGRFHLDDFGAEFAQQLGSEWPGDQLAKFDDLQPSQSHGMGVFIFFHKAVQDEV